MAAFVDTSCLYSTVKNASTKRRFFGYLPPHGQSLDAGEEFTLFGDVTAAVVLDVERATSRHHMAAFEKDVEEGTLEIIKTPSPLLKDVTTGETKMLVLDNGTLSDEDPCWAGTVSDSVDPYQPY